MEVLATPAQAPIDPLASRRYKATDEDQVNVTDEDQTRVRHFTLHINHAFKVTTGERELPLYYIAGEPFMMEVHDGLIVLHHQVWSLRGEGPTLLEAEQDLLSFAIAISPAYIHHPYDKLTKRAQALKDFLLRVI